MVFVTLGNQNFQFKRLLINVEKLKKEGIIKQKIVAQVGHTNFESEQIETREFLSKKEFDQCIEKADFIICHAGTGSIINAIKNNKKVIVAARLAKHNEHIDDHQREILEAFVNRNLILGLKDDLSDFESKINNLDNFIPEKFVSNNKFFNKKLIEIINNL
jgi:UDP-N-acetylglucosamine transferase subunit ALG13